MLKLGIYEHAIPLHYGWEEKFHTAKAAGFDFIEFSIDGLQPRLGRLDWSEKKLRDIKDIADWFEMPFVTLALTANRYFPLGDSDESVRQKGINIVEKAIKIAGVLGAEIIHVAPYDVKDNLSTIETKENFDKSILYLADKAEKVDVTIAIEVLEDVPHFSTIRQGVEYVERIDRKNIQLYGDFGNVASIGVKPELDLRYNQGQIKGCHVKDASIGNCRNVPFGKGIVDFEACFQHFKEIDYQGTFVAELWCDEVEIPLLDLRKVSKFIRSFF